MLGDEKFPLKKALSNPEVALKISSHVIKPANFLKSLADFRTSQITANKVERVEKVIKTHSLSVENMKRASCAAAGLLGWLEGILAFYHLTKE